MPEKKSLNRDAMYSKDKNQKDEANQSKLCPECGEDHPSRLEPARSSRGEDDFQENPKNGSETGDHHQSRFSEQEEGRSNVFSRRSGSARPEAND